MDEVCELITEAKKELITKPKNFKEFFSNMRKETVWMSAEDGSYRGVLDLSFSFKSEDKELKYNLILFSNATSHPVIMTYNMDSDLMKHMTDVAYEKSGHWSVRGAFYPSESQTLEIMKHFKKIFQNNKTIKSQINKMWEEDYYRYSNVFELFNKAGISEINKNSFKF